MIQLSEMNEETTLRDQLEEGANGTAVLVNVFQVPEQVVEPFLKAWADDAAWFKQQAGFISAQLHRGIAGSTTFLNYAEWQSAAHFAAAFAHPEFRSKLARYPDGVTTTPHLFRRLEVRGVCSA